MNIGSIITLIIAVAEAVPIISKWVDTFYNMLTDKKISEIDGKIADQNQKRTALIKAISKAETDDERKALSVILHDIDSF